MGSSRNARICQLWSLCCKSLHITSSSTWCNSLQKYCRMICRLAGLVQSGGLQKIQEVKAEVGSKLHDFIDEINMLYPPEIVQYYSPNYAETLLKKMGEYNPTG